MIKITCTSCQKPLSIDETKLPMKEVAFPCPACKTKIKVDRRKLGATATVQPEASPVPPPESEDQFGEKAVLIGNDHPQIRQALKSLGRQVMHFPNSEAARDFFLQEYPSLVVFNPAQATAPPIADMAPMLQIVSSDRRKGFFILVADNLRTLDGNAAFLYNVNLIVATKDLPNFERVFREADSFHQRLYANL
jgi:predicted RNA-binding Zn-ribbon protein involved in translation (DUF1610 family)